MDPALRRAWTEIVAADDYEQHMAAIGQAQAAAALTAHVLEACALPRGSRIVVAGAGTGQMLDYLDAALLKPHRLTFTDLNPVFLDRLRGRLDRCGLTANVFADDIERTALGAGADLLMATLLLEHIDWRRGVQTFIGLRPGICAAILQENPPGMTSAVTPGRRLPASMARAMESAHATLVPLAELTAAFHQAGYDRRETVFREVADGKRLIAAVFTNTPPALK